MSSASSKTSEGAGPGGLRRTLGFSLLVFYGLGLIVGAGIYVLIGAVAAKSGMLTPAAFLVAGALAALTGLSYAELAARMPEAAGAVAYVHHAFGRRWLAHAVAVGVLLVALIGAATIARGSAGYVAPFVTVPGWLPGAVFVALATGLACLRIDLGAGLAAVIGFVEIAALIAVAATGADALGDIAVRAAELVPADGRAWLALGGGAFLAFFAFVGFEALTNMAEEAKAPERTVPRVIVAAIAASAFLYVFVALVAVLALPLDRLAGSTAPLCLLLERRGLGCGQGFAALALLALSNGVFAEIVLVARLLYGMAKRGLAPPVLARVAPGSGVPVVATLAGGGAALLLAVLVPFDSLAGATSAATIAVFAVVNAALLRLKFGGPARRHTGFAVPMAIPFLGLIACLGLLVAAALG